MRKQGNIKVIDLLRENLGQKKNISVNRKKCSRGKKEGKKIGREGEKYERRGQDQDIC